MAALPNSCSAFPASLSDPHHCDPLGFCRWGTSIPLTDLCLCYSLKGGGVCHKGLGDQQGGPEVGGGDAPESCPNVCEPGNHRAASTVTGAPDTGRRATSPLFSRLSFCLPPPLPRRAYRPVINSIWSTLPWSCIPSIFRCLVFFSLIFVSLVNQHWNRIGLAAQSRGRTICLVWVLFWGIPGGGGSAFLPTG